MRLKTVEYNGVVFFGSLSESDTTIYIYIYIYNFFFNVFQIVSGFSRINFLFSFSGKKEGKDFDQFLNIVPSK
ncbi:MAG: hypothetical protein MCS20_01520, partial [Candidatus Phytoplasma mali]|nr:hypothetical protein [Candidatus Phytoplasma mali]